ncbi:MAG: 3-ketoacyl-ACP reductase [Candidatus Aminicenantes bacterium]|nr:3-ketoacyl-ACP reductase [Candidatus Aminicenantes bacterium]
MKKNRSLALVTGAGRGIGRGISLELARNGYDILGADIVWEPKNYKEGLFEVKKSVEKEGGRFVPFQTDISDISGHDRLLDEARRLGGIDILVNNAGVAPVERQDILQTTPESYDGLQEVNVRGPFFLTQKAAQMMIENVRKDPKRRRCIIFISSISAYVSSKNRAEYCISKAALSQAARIFADRLAAEGINVYEVRPGIIKTPMTAGVADKYNRLIGEGLVPQKRWGLPEDVGKAVAALAKGYFSYSTGAVIEVSGGMNIPRL